MRYFQVTSYVTVKNEELEFNEYVKVPNQKVDQFLKGFFIMIDPVFNQVAYNKMNTQ